MSEFLQTINPLYSLSGLFVGALVGFTGVGGGSLMTPLLVLLFGIHPTTAVGTDLLYAGVTKICGSAVHNSNHAVDWRIVRRMASGSVPAAVATLVLLNYFGHDNNSVGTVITTVLGFALILTAVTLVFRRWLLQKLAHALDAYSDRQIALLTVALGAIIGALVSLSSVGAGAIGVTALLTLYPKMPTVRIVGSDIAHAVPLTLLAGLGHWMIGSIDGHLLVSLLVGSIPGVVLGSYASTLVPDTALRLTLAATLILAGTRLVF